MRTRWKVFLVLIVIAAACGPGRWASASEEPRPPGRITVDEARRMIEERSEGVVVLDVRTPAEFASGHIEGALNIDFYSKDFKDRLATLDKDKTYIVHCRSGARSARAWKIMRSLGFDEVYDMGGIVEWAKKGYPLVK